MDRQDTSHTKSIKPSVNLHLTKRIIINIFKLNKESKKYGSQVLEGEL